MDTGIVRMEMMKKQMIYFGCDWASSGNYSLCRKNIPLEITLSILIVDLKILQTIDIDQFSDMSNVRKSFQLNLDLSTHLTPLHPNAFQRHLENV